MSSKKGATGGGGGDVKTTGPEALGMSQVLFVEVGMGADQHGGGWGGGELGAPLYTCVTLGGV